MNKPELLAPAGDMEKLKFALQFGADAVYLGGKNWGLRAYAGNFTMEEISEAVMYSHSMNKKVYVTVNIFAHNQDLVGLNDYLLSLHKENVDGIIVSDPGIIRIAKETVPELPIHLSTQENTTNWSSAQFWKEYGVKRIVLARELSLKEIKEIKQKVGVEIEAFVHGAMCMAYSGRCLLSNYLVGRGANQGECAHPCRYKYYLIEEKRPDQMIGIEEDERGSYIFNSKDLCLIEHIPELINSGIDSFKIEGRMKSVHYVTTVVKAYRQAIDDYVENPNNYKFNEQLLNEVSKVSHREYTTGFYFDKITNNDHNYRTSKYKRTYDFIGIVNEYDAELNQLIIEQRNHFGIGDLIELCPPAGENKSLLVQEMFNEDGENITKAPHPQQIVKVTCADPMPRFTIIRRAKKDE